MKSMKSIFYRSKAVRARALPAMIGDNFLLSFVKRETRPLRFASRAAVITNVRGYHPGSAACTYLSVFLSVLFLRKLIILQGDVKCNVGGKTPRAEMWRARRGTMAQLALFKERPTVMYAGLNHLDWICVECRQIWNNDCSKRTSYWEAQLSKRWS